MAAAAKGKNWQARLSVRSKVWLELDGEPVFSRGRAQLFRAIDRQGSINAAAREMGISYRRAWGYVKAMEARLGVPLVTTMQGGAHGGGASLTEAARELLAGYERLERGVEDEVDARFAAEFGRRQPRW